MLLETLPHTLKWPPHGIEKDLVEEYREFQINSGYAFDEKIRPWAARAFLQRYSNLSDWREAPLAEQLALRRQLKYFANFLFLKHYLRPTLLYLLTARPKLAKVGKRYLYAQIYTQLYQVGQQLGYCDATLRRTFHLLFYVTVHAGKEIQELAPADLQAFEDELRTLQLPNGFPFCLRQYSENLFRSRILLFHAGILPELAQRYRPHPARSRQVLWTSIPRPIQEVVWRYLDQLDTV